MEERHDFSKTNTFYANVVFTTIWSNIWCCPSCWSTWTTWVNSKTGWTALHVDNTAISWKEKSQFKTSNVKNEIVTILFNFHTFLLSYTYSIILIAQVLNCITIKIECFKSSINSCVILKTSIWRAEKFKSIFFFKKVKLFERKPFFLSIYLYFTPQEIWLILISQYLLKVPLNVKAKVAESVDSSPTFK